MDKRNLLETATLVESPDSGPWKVRLISEGKGSSGIYSAELLENYGSAFNESLSFENHPVGWDGPQSRNFTQIVGQVVGETWTDTDDRGKVGVYANWEPDPEHRERLSRYKKKLGLSIYIEGDGHVDEDGEFVVDMFNGQDPFKSVDVVIAAGRGGQFEESLKKIYSQRSESKPGTDPSVQERKDTKDMDEIKELTAKVETLTSAVETLVSAQTAKVEEDAQTKADQNAVEEAVAQRMESVKAVEAARDDLLPSQVEDLLAEAGKGADVTPLIEKAKKVSSEAKTQVQESASAGRVITGSNEWKSGAWA